jgi:hypothetical protein
MQITPGLLSFALLLLGALLVFFAVANVGGNFSVTISNRRARLLVGGIGTFFIVLGLVGVVREMFITPPNNSTASVNPTDTSVPAFTSTLPQANPTPTDTPQPIPTTTPTAEAAALTMYDDFNDARFDGSFDPGKWYVAASDGKVSQQAGILTFEVDTSKGNNISLQALPYREKYFESRTFFEAKLMVPKAQSGHLYILIVSLPSPQRLETDCIAGGSFGEAFGCGLHYGGTSFEDYSHSIEAYGEWHTVRIEIDPTTSTITYFVDGNEIKSLVADKLKEQRFSFEIGFFSEEPKQIYTGYIDDVSIGQIP